MTVDQFKQDLHQVAKNVRDFVASLAAVGNTVTITEAAVSG